MEREFGRHSARARAARASLRLPLGGEAWGVAGPELQPELREAAPSILAGWIAAVVRALMRRRRPVRHHAAAPTEGLPAAR